MRKLIITLSAVLFFVISAAAQDRTVTGRVVNDRDVPMDGVSVSTPDGKAGTQTNKDGSYSITISSSVRTLIFSYVNFETQTRSVASVVNVSLAPGGNKLEEVVVVGYGTQRRKEATGNVSSVKGSAIAERPVQSFEAALGGKAAGVQITIPNGVLNNPPVLRVRGVNSLSLSTFPLIVIDGVPSFTGDAGATSAPANPLASINPNDIESIDIAKDAAAAAIYGSRASNGVIFVTTKKGRSGKAKITYDAWTGFSRAYRLPEVLDVNQYVQYKNVALANLKTLVPATTGNFIIPTGPDGNPVSTNWYDQVYRQGNAQSHTVSVSGGNEATTYYLSTGYTKQQGILQKNDFQRMNILMNIDSKVSKIVSIGGKVAFSNELNLIGGTSGSLNGEAFSSAGAARLSFALPPNVSPFNNNGTYNYSSISAIGGQGSLVNGSNPYTFNNVRMLLDLNRSNNEVSHLQSNAYVQLKPLKFLTLRSTYGVDYLLIDNDIFYNPFHGDGAGTSLGPGGAGTATFSKDKTWLWTNTAQADFTLGQNHNISALVGNEQQRRTSTGLGIARKGLSDSAYTNAQSGYTTNNPAGLTLGENYLISTFGRLNYNYKRKYFLSGNLRQDKYSALGIKEGTFWGASAGWEIAQESFWKNSGISKTVSSLKFRGSYGKVGNFAGLGNYSAYSSYASGIYGGTSTLQFSTVGNDKIQWETSTKTDIGFSFGLFKDRITGEFSYYKNDIDHLILGVPQAPSTGLQTTILQNVGTMYNKGIEIGLNAAVIQSKAFNWNTSFNISFNKNLVTSLAPGLTEILTATSGLESVSKTLPGYSAGYLFVVRSGGVDPQTGRRIFLNKAGDKVYYQPNAAGGVLWQNQDGTQYKKNGVNAIINQTDDGQLYANAVPKVYGGWDNNFSYKQFDISILTTFQEGSYNYYGSGAGLLDQRFWNNSTAVLGYWKQPGDITNIPRPIYGDNTSNGSAIPMDINVYKADFIKLKSVQIGYTIQREILEKAKISSIRFYVSGQNLGIITKYPGPDPEVSSNGNSPVSIGVDRNTLANARTLTAGLNINF